MKKTPQLPKLLMLLIFLFAFQSLTTAQQMRVNKSDGTVIEIPIADIQKLTFVDLTFLPSQQALVNKLLQMKLYPNPAKEHMNIEYKLTESGYVTLEILSLQGALLQSSPFGNQPAGDYSFKLQTSNLASGLYICIIRQNQLVVSEKMIIKK